MCRTWYIVEKLVDEGKLSWTDVVFKFEGDEEDLELLAGGMCGMFQKDTLSKAQKKELREAGVRQDEAFRQNIQARAGFMFCVVDDANPGAGPVVATESKSLGQKMQLEIKKQMKRDPQRGDPTLHPYPFEWKYDKDAKIQDRY
ncbi:MAG: hypothetical protein HC945_03480, partial [Nitrosarchaeum sp.]|nr:hypothetical protein [Nitrosarchaeum sp.]